jgi:hypothetical protein
VVNAYVWDAPGVIGAGEQVTGLGGRPRLARLLRRWDVGDGRVPRWEMSRG